MYETILLPLDGSLLAERALPFATALARASQARLVVVRAEALPETEREERVDPFTGTVYTVDTAARYLQEVEERLATSSTGKIRVESDVQSGNPAEVILRAVEAHGADMLVMATHGRSGLGRWLYGSVADAVLRATPVPVLLVPAAAARAWSLMREQATGAESGTQSTQSRSGAEGIRGGASSASTGGTGGSTGPTVPFRVLVPLDGSDLAQAAVEPATVLARAFNAELILLQVVQLPVTPAPVPFYGAGPGLVSYNPTGDIDDAHQRLEVLATRLRTGGQRVEVLVEVGRPVMKIADVAQERQVSVIAMATHGRGGLARVVLGSVATATVQQARCPLLLVRPAAISEQAGETASEAEGTAT